MAILRYKSLVTKYCGNASMRGRVRKDKVPLSRQAAERVGMCFHTGTSIGVSNKWR